MPKPALRFFCFLPGHYEVHWEEKICPEQLQVLLRLRDYVQKAFPNAIIRHTYHILSVMHPPDSDLERCLEAFLDSESTLWKCMPTPTRSQRTWWIPLCYAPSLAPDLPAFCASKGLEPEEFIALHTAPAYTVYFQGFRPGFYYLGGLDARLHHPRKANPALRLPAGTCGIGGEQTGIYPSESPGGWWQIAHCPLSLVPEYGKEPPIQAGDHLRFIPITLAEHTEIQRNKLDLTLIQNRYG
ncbi:allophanate hydrolase subunit 1 [Nitritalea halalkaliphila LW7]|uniref:Allophanate hydrolase subunit 1 n=1 Tax=Nitritalea halalkaliphila LW7 TaxID=1189621 RepID=I5C3S0_9BACT|nr:carboxyltransferase domain-containing protein [Nitritalea halalkaliphila]EIM76472.1 allophanate hydrolase subunit 1 [Nitritalea halalkaliphila LW7]